MTVANGDILVQEIRNVFDTIVPDGTLSGVYAASAD